jgi:hypothetical protein
MCLRVFLTYSVTSKLTVKFLKRAIVFDLQLDFSSALQRGILFHVFQFYIRSLWDTEVLMWWVGVGLSCNRFDSVGSRFDRAQQKAQLWT